MLFDSSFSKKQNLRSFSVRKRQQLSSTYILSISSAIYTHALPLIKDSTVVAFYYPINQEPNLMLLWESAWTRNIITLLPKVLSKQEMIFCPFSSEDELREGSFGIPEPYTNPFKDTIDIIFVPGLAFGYDGSRLGYGAGYYDRFLNSVSSKKIGVCYHHELQYSLPIEEHDIIMDAVVTDQGVFSSHIFE